MNSALPQTHTSVLLVDDDEHIQKLVSVMLRRSGYEVTIASDGVEALRRVAEAIPHLIVADVMMPNMDGLEMLKRLRADPATQPIPVILLTAKGMVEDVVSGLSLGADDYLTKPFEMAELLARVRAKVERPPVPSELLIQDRQTGLLVSQVFTEEARREIRRAGRGGAAGCLAYFTLAELAHLEEQFGLRARDELAKQIAGLALQTARPLDVIGRDSEGYFAMLLPESSPEAAQRVLRALADKIMEHTFKIRSVPVHVTPTIGYTAYTTGKDFETLRLEALTALDHAASQLDLVPRRYQASMGGRRTGTGAGLWERLRRNWGSPVQFAVTIILSWVIPFLLYLWLNLIGHDISRFVYLALVIALASTAFLVWLEGFYGLKLVNPPEQPKQPYPPATAIIAAYLPNEASTVLETVKAFLCLDYPAPLQIILAYNTPVRLPIEDVLRQIAELDTRFLPLRLEDSTSKAQNINGALERVKGEFVGIFDADHHPNPQNFKRAWRWLSEGYDVVQGHCQVRNGSDAWVAEMVAVEFEAIYAVSHPGRARLYDFGIFGGSNGYWRTDLLRQTRLRGSMLTEDIDSSIRITEAGKKIVSDPLLVSKELAPLTLTALWNQRMRWAQGWYQVSLKYFWKALGSHSLSLRQKAGIVWLLGWREVYPWIATQIFPLIGFWAIKYNGLNHLNWLIPIFVLTTLFTFSVGPGQTLFAYLLAVPEVRQHKKWFFAYLIRSLLFYTEFKNAIGRIAQIKELMGERQWKVTPRNRVGSPHADRV